MKKFLIVLLIVALGLGLMAGCTTSEDTQEEGFDATRDITVITREEGSGTRGAFIELVGIEQKDENGEKVDYTSIDADVANGTAAVMTNVR